MQMLYDGVLGIFLWVYKKRNLVCYVYLEVCLSITALVPSKPVRGGISVYCTLFHIKKLFYIMKLYKTSDTRLSSRVLSEYAPKIYRIEISESPYKAHFFICFTKWKSQLNYDMKEKALETVFTWYYSGIGLREIHSDSLPFFAPTHASFSVNGLLFHHQTKHFLSSSAFTSDHLSNQKLYA